MNRIKILLPFLLLTTVASPKGEEDGHMHGPDGRHIVTPQDTKGAESMILSHHDMRVEGPDGKSVLGAVVNSVIIAKGKPGVPIHTEKNVYEPDNEVYGSHMTYTSPGEYVLRQDVKMPDGRQLQVEFPVLVEEESATGEAEHDHHGPNYLLIFGGGILGVAALVAAFRMGKKSGTGGVAALVILALLVGLLPTPARAGDDEEGHAHGPDGRHIVTETGTKKEGGPRFKAYPGAKGQSEAAQTVDGVKFTLTIENEEVKADPDLLALTDQQSKVIGLQTAVVEVSNSASALQTTGRVTANPNGLVKINSRSGGRVLRLGALPGTAVRRGQMLAVIESPDLADAQAAYRSANTELAQSQAGIKVAEATVSAARSDLNIAQRNLARQQQMANAGEFASPSLERARSAVSEAKSELDSAAAAVSQLEKLVRRLREGLASGVVAQREVERAEAELAQANATKLDAGNQLRLAQDALRREESIAKDGLRNSQEVDQARAQVEQAQSALKSGLSRLNQAKADTVRVNGSIRVARDQIGILGGTPGSGHTITLTAPIDAEVEHRMVSVGQSIAAGELLYDLLNADVVWILADVFEKDIPKVKVGQAIEVSADPYPNEVYEGEIAFIHNEVDPQTRTTPVRIVIDNPGELLKQNMFVRVNLGVDRGGGGGGATIPAAAIQKSAGLDVVFVQERAGVFRKTMVQVKRSLGNRVVVEGVRSGQTIATTGSYQLVALAGGK